MICRHPQNMVPMSPPDRKISMDSGKEPVVGRGKGRTNGIDEKEHPGHRDSCAHGSVTESVRPPERNKERWKDQDLPQIRNGNSNLNAEEIISMFVARCTKAMWKEDNMASTKKQLYGEYPQRRGTKDSERMECGLFPDSQERNAVVMSRQSLKVDGTSTVDFASAYSVPNQADEVMNQCEADMSSFVSKSTENECLGRYRSGGWTRKSCRNNVSA